MLVNAKIIGRQVALRIYANRLSLLIFAIVFQFHLCLLRLCNIREGSLQALVPGLGLELRGGRAGALPAVLGRPGPRRGGGGRGAGGGGGHLEAGGRRPGPRHPRHLPRPLVRPLQDDDARPRQTCSCTSGHTSRFYSQ